VISLDLEIEQTQLGDSILSFVSQNGSKSELLPPLGERINPESDWYLARSGDAVVGAASISYVDDIARVGEFCVSRDLRRRGIGREMLGKIVEEARSRGSSRIMLTGVDLREEESRGFAEAMGFRLDRDGIRMEWHPRPIPEVELPDGYRLRTFREGDEAAWSDLINRAYSTTPNKTEYTPQKVRENWTSTPCFMSDGCFFVTRGSDLVGCFMAWREVDAGPRRGRLHWLAVDPEHRRRGIAKFLTVAVIEHLKEKGLDSIFLDTGYNLPVAMAMYRKLGFVETPRLFDYVVDLA
jgi:mycothiol synthase